MGESEPDGARAAAADPERAANLEHNVARARAGERAALELVVRTVQKDVYNLALRFLWHPQDAEDATQEVLIRVVTGLANFRGDSGFRTWVYRIACNTLLTLRRQRMEQQSVSLEEFGEDLARGLSDDALRVDDDVDESLMLEEVRIGCTMAMLQCLDRAERMAYILGDVIELDHNVAARVLGTTPAAYRKRLSRARARIVPFMTSHCGLVNTANACRCRRRVNTAVALGRVDPSNLLFAPSLERAKQFPQLLAEVRRLEETQRAAALYQLQPQANPPESFIVWMKQLLGQATDAPGGDADHAVRTPSARPH